MPRKKEIKTKKLSAQRSATNDANIMFWAGVAVATGALGVLIASVFYALSPVPAALPIPNPSFVNALNAMIAGRITMMAAGTFGIIFDLIFSGGVLLLMVFRKPAGLEIERLGWAFVTISVLIFITVDSLSANVLTQKAVLKGAAASFAGFKLLYDTLFVLGTIAFGLGAPIIFTGEMKSGSPLLPKLVIWIGIFFACCGLVSGLLYFANVSLPQVIGISIAAGSLLFVVYGVQIARSELQ